MEQVKYWLPKKTHIPNKWKVAPCLNGTTLSSFHCGRLRTSRSNLFDFFFFFLSLDFGHSVKYGCADSSDVLCLLVIRSEAS